MMSTCRQIHRMFANIKDLSEGRAIITVSTVFFIKVIFEGLGTEVSW